MTYYDEHKWCTHCRASVPFLSSIGHTYCTECGREVTSYYSPAERRALRSMRLTQDEREPDDPPPRRQRKRRA